jgi:hypothetical protein
MGCEECLTANALQTLQPIPSNLQQFNLLAILLTGFHQAAANSTHAMAASNARRNLFFCPTTASAGASFFSKARPDCGSVRRRMRSPRQLFAARLQFGFRFSVLL